MLGFLATVRKQFRQVSKPAIPGSSLSLTDCLMAGLAVFSLKYPSLLKCDHDRADGIIRHNLESLFGIQQVPRETYLRERLDRVCPIGCASRLPPCLPKFSAAMNWLRFSLRTRIICYRWTGPAIFHRIKCIVSTVALNRVSIELH